MLYYLPAATWNIGSKHVTERSERVFPSREGPHAGDHEPEREAGRVCGPGSDGPARRTDRRGAEKGTESLDCFNSAAWFLTDEL